MEKKQQERKFQVVESLLAKPTKKPDFSSFGESDILKKAAAFLPQFIQTTDKMLSDPDTLRKHLMDIRVIDKDHQIGEDNDNEGESQEHQTINMDIGVGVYDILNSDFQESTFKPTSTEPIIRVQGMNNEIGSSSSESSNDDSDDLYYEFNSSESENQDGISSTTKSTSQKRPMIVDITPQKEEVKQQKTKNNKRKRQRTK